MFAARIDQWLGCADEGAGQRRGIVIIGDLRAEDPGAADGTRSRIAIEARTGAASESALAVLETPYASGAEVTFVGRVTILADCDEAKEIAAAIERGLNWVPQFGGARTVGFGRTLGVALESETLPAAPAAPEAEAEAEAAAETKAEAEATTADGIRLRLVLRFIEPFCISAAPRSANVFDSESTVPGGAIKGALASQLKAALGWPAAAEIPPAPAEDAPFAKLCLWFNAIRIAHAVPIPVEAAPGCAPMAFTHAGRLQGALAPPVDLRGWPPRPRTWPLSLVASRDGALFDVALSDNPCLIDDTAPTAPIDANRPSKPHASAPRFAPDWKGDDFARDEALFGLSEPPRALRLRTAMDPDLRAGAPEQLFAYEMVLPDRHLWVGEIDLGDVAKEDRQAVLNDLRALTKEGIAGIGKTHALAQVALAPMPAAAASAAAAESLEPISEHVIITLQTPALLCTNGDLLLPTGGGQKNLTRAYREAFRDLSKNNLELMRFFARQRLAGGAFYLQRYAGNETYLPWLLTEAGSVFVLKPVGRRNDVKKTLQRWASGGLPLPQSVRKGHGLAQAGSDASLWRHCPFIRQNGYGEVAINLAVHLSHAVGARAVPVGAGS